MTPASIRSKIKMVGRRRSFWTSYGRTSEFDGRRDRSGPKLVRSGWGHLHAHGGAVLQPPVRERGCFAAAVRSRAGRAEAEIHADARGDRREPRRTFRDGRAARTAGAGARRMRPAAGRRALTAERGAVL